MAKNVKRLFSSFQPSHYDVSLSLHDDKRSFNGKVIISGKKTGRPSKRLTFHQKGLTITKAEVVSLLKKTPAKVIPLSRTVLHASYDEVRLHSEETLYPGDYTVTLEFHGRITKNMDGIYPCFFEMDGVQKELIATQFESHHAREAFPCIDEPEAKATFKLSLDHASHETALGNTPVENEHINGDRKVTEFAITPIMSTYLVAFVVGELSYKEAKSKRGVTIRTYTVPDQIENSEFALEVAVKAMDFYEDYYDIPFPLPKCDFVALPDFASGAMENWGLITFREQTMLCDEHTSLGTKQYVAIVVAHELTHQWFGNLVTMRWWTDLWLNEGFASWMEYLAVDTLFPEWDLWTQFSVDEQQSALKADALEFTHPIEVPVHHPDEIRTIFDIISYQKGASVIHMLNDYLGAKDFQAGLQHYLKKFAYKNAETRDLWQALEDVSGKPVTTFMQTWTSKSGYPLLSVELENNAVICEQKRFVLNPESTARNDTTLWPIPLLAKELPDALVKKRKTVIPLVAKNAPLVLNQGLTGFYRTDYSPSMQKHQADALQRGTMSNIDRMGLLSDGFEVTKAGYQSVTDYLALLENYRNETELPAWEIISASLSAIRHTLAPSDSDDSLRDAMKPFVAKLSAQELHRLGWEKHPDEKHLDSLLRPLIISLSASADEPATLEKLHQMYRKKIQNGEAIDPDLRAIAYVTVARTGGQKEYDELLEAYSATQSSDEKLSITAAMTSFQQPELHAKVLALLSSDTIRTQDLSYWIAYSFMNRHSRRQTWQWLQENWAWLKEVIGTDLGFARVPVYVARNFTDSEFLQEYTTFFESKMEPVIKRSYDQGFEIIQTNIAWHKRDAEVALAWFKARL